MAELTELRPRSMLDPTRSPVGPPGARSLLLTVLGEYVMGLDRPVWTRTLLRALVVLGVREKAARQAIARSSRDAWLQRERVGREVRWWISSETADLLRRGAERIYNFQGITYDWDRRWLLLMVSVPEERRDHRHRLRSRLAWAGFGSLGQGVWITPHLAREREAREVLAELEPAVDATSFVAEHGRIGDERALVADAWGGLSELESAYDEFIEQFARLRPDSDQSMFQAQSQLVHAWRKFPFADPGLPAKFLPDDWRGEDAQALFNQRHEAWAAGASAWFSEGL